MQSQQTQQTPAPVQPLLYTVDDVCKMLSISKDTAYRMMAAGTLPYIKLSRKIRRIRHSDLIKMINEA
jgi:excisionase family DNA binding protein